ncbi:MAG: hypothetical protein KC615_07320 [Anaerolineae bacterium]|nr:hypothetical protein [Anaerolineae bacterium]MCA9892777.1 hypothetical protein [Anaerolineae bacterium]
MNSKMIMGILLMVMGGADLFLNAWLYLLNYETRPLLMAGVGLLILVAGFVHFQRGRREKQEKQKNEF